MQPPPLCKCGHLYDAMSVTPARRKSSLTSWPLEAGFSCSYGTISSMTTSKPPWPLTVSCPLNPRALPGRLGFPGPWHARTPRNASCTDFRLRDRRSRRLWGNRNDGALSGRHSAGANRPDVSVRSKRGLDLLQDWPPWRPSNGRSVHLHRDWGQRAEMRPVVSERQGRFASRAEGFRGWPVWGLVQQLGWWLSGDTGAMWLDRCGEDADRLFFHGLAERLPSPVTVRPSRGERRVVGSCVWIW